MLANILWMVLGIALLFGGGESLVRSSARLALRLGMTPLLVGLTVVAFGTSSPELVVSVKAALSGLGDVAMGNVVGSNMFNIGVILAITALLCPLAVQLQILKFDAWVMLAASVAVAAVFADQTVSRIEAGAFALGIIVYTGANILMARREAAALEAEFAESMPAQKSTAWMDVVWILGGLALLVVGSRFLVDGAAGLARAAGVSEAVIGLTIVAAGTSMPELASSIVAAIRKQPDIALGNIVGSNIFNILCILGVSALAAPIHAPGIEGRDIWVMIVFAAVLVPLLWSGQRLQRWEGGVLLAGYAAYLAAIWPK